MTQGYLVEWIRWGDTVRDAFFQSLEIANSVAQRAIDAGNQTAMRKATVGSDGCLIESDRRSAFAPTPKSWPKALDRLTDSGVLGNDRCECFDAVDGHSLEAGKTSGQCTNKATCTLYRVDMQDETGTRFCDHCADDALSSGLFTGYSEEELLENPIGEQIYRQVKTDSVYMKT